MKEEKKSRKESACNNFADMFKQFGSALGEIFYPSNELSDA